MNKKEMAQILAVIKAAYPHIKIEDAGATVQAWLWTLGDYSAEAVAKAAQLHIATSKFFPSPADIHEKIVRAEIVYNEADIETNKIEPSKQKLLGNDNQLTVIDDFSFDMFADLEPSEVCLKCEKLHECYPDYK